MVAYSPQYTFIGLFTHPLFEKPRKWRGSKITLPLQVQYTQKADKGCFSILQSVGAPNKPLQPAMHHFLVKIRENVQKPAPARKIKTCCPTLTTISVIMCHCQVYGPAIVVSF